MMVSLPTMLLIIGTAVLLCAASAEVNVITYTTVEQRPRGTFIGNIAESARLQENLPQSEFKTLRFSFLPENDPSSKFLRIKQNSGEIFSNVALDREKICDISAIECLVSFKSAVLSDSGNTFQVLQVNIYIEDINDKYPLFPRNHITLRIPENTLDSYEIRPAVDNDAGLNSIQSYELVPATGPFGLREVKQPGGSTKLSIVVKENLDREATDFYQVRVLAKDGGSPSRTGEVQVDIAVKDLNDHSPKFTEVEYVVSRPENISIGTPLVKVKASDLDLNENGQVRYHLYSQPSGTFSINETTGQVFLGKPLDFEGQSRYKLVVEARDLGTPSLTSQAIVVVNVEDVNDDQPKIIFNLLSKGSNAEIPEDAAPGRFVAYVSVTDRDSGNNGDVACQLDTSVFKLDSLGSKDFNLKLNAPLDRETQDTYNVRVVCQDGGNPPLSGTGQFVVKVKDVNDHDPLFDQPVYSMTLEENNHIGANILKVTATDKDIGDNGKIIYELGDDAGNRFSINRDTGEIKARVRLDREKTPEIVFHVIAKDRGVPRGADTATVTLTLLDQNDESPLFSQPEYMFRTLENGKPGMSIGSVYAMDLDEGLGGDVLYSILPYSDPDRLFSMSRTDGTIKINKGLDRENGAEVKFVVRARDKGEPSRSSTAQVTVFVMDKNDNKPVMFFPDKINNTVEILHTLSKNSFVTMIEASDLDEGENAKLSFEIKSGNRKGLFTLDRSNGVLSVKRTMKKSDAGNYKLVIEVQDNSIEEEPLTTQGKLTVVVVQSNESVPVVVPILTNPNQQRKTNETAGESAKDNNVMMIIVICVVVATVVISVILIGSICIVVRKRSARRPNYFVQPEEQKIMKQHKDSPSNSIGGKVPPPPSPNESDDNKLRKKEVSFSLEEVRENCQNLANSSPNASFTTFKGLQQTGSNGHSPSEPQLPVAVNLGNVHSNLQSSGTQSSTSDNLHENPSQRQDDQEPSHNILQHKEMSWAHKRPIEVKHLLDLLHKDDSNSDTSGETFNSDSGRGGSEEESHSSRGQHHMATDQSNPRYYATKYSPGMNNLSMDHGGSNIRHMPDRLPPSPNGTFSSFRGKGGPGMPKLDLGRDFPRNISLTDNDSDSGMRSCSSFRQPQQNYSTFKSAKMGAGVPGNTPSPHSPLPSPMSCGSGCNLVSSASGTSSQTHSLERTKPPHSPMFKVKAPGWEPVSNMIGYNTAGVHGAGTIYPDIIGSHDFRDDAGYEDGVGGESMAYCRDDDEMTTTSGSYTVNADELCDDINQMFFTDVIV